jgi:nitrite reductase/ring-hydroxylating ferredoxin subunit/uncharacterized membrane protein
VINELLQGKPFGHPLHPAMVHLPVGLFVLSLLLDLATIFVNDASSLLHGAFYTMTFGVVTAVLAAFPGLADWSDIRADHPAKKIATYHMLLNLTAVALYIANLGLRYWVWNVPRHPILPLVPKTPFIPLFLSFVGVSILSISGYLGGKLIYDEGIAVGRHRRHTRAPSNTIHISSAEIRDGFASVAAANMLNDGETLRVEAENRVMTVAKLAGKFYAFQEFCTHRFGPLSEGSFHDKQVECPWHRSCFDVSTGKVTHGPAKVDLEVYEVSVRDGHVWVRLPKEVHPEVRQVG